MDWMKKHTDTVIVLGGILSAVMWMNGRFNEVDRRFSEVDKRFNEVDRRFAEVENRLTKIETIIYIKGLVSHELAVKNDGRSHE